MTIFVDSGYQLVDIILKVWDRGRWSGLGTGCCVCDGYCGWL